MYIHTHTRADCVCVNHRGSFMPMTSVSASPILNPQSPVFQADSYPCNRLPRMHVCMSVCECAPLSAASFCFRFRKLTTRTTFTKRNCNEARTNFLAIFLPHVCPCTSVGMQEFLSLSLRLSVSVSVRLRVCDCECVRCLCFCSVCCRLRRRHHFANRFSFFGGLRDVCSLWRFFATFCGS